MAGLFGGPLTFSRGNMQRLFISFSGGRSSAYMMKRLHDEYSDVYEMTVGFSNTGQENEKTLRFVDRCSREWSIPVTWMEAVVHNGERLSCTHRIVDFASASREGEPFEAVIQKYGIPNKAWPHCTRELKLNPMRSYLESIGWQGCLTAVGIRADEPARIGTADGIIYPMATMFPTTKPEILEWWKRQPFDLGLMEHQGNCTWCWKKSLAKHVRIAKESPEVFEFPARMEALYGLSGRNVDGTKRVFFRENRSTQNILSISALLSPQAPLFPEEDAGCSESCEAF